MSFKTKYSSDAANMRSTGFADKKTQKKFEHAKERYDAFKSGYQKVDFNDFVSKFAPDCSVEYIGTKIKYYSKITDYTIIADVSGYLRLIKGSDYIGNKNYCDINGNVVGEGTSELKQKTHFKILHIGENK